MTKQEAAEGKFDGPWPVSLDTAGTVHSQVPCQRWLPTQRFVISVFPFGASLWLLRRSLPYCGLGLDLGGAARREMKSAATRLSMALWLCSVHVEFHALSLEQCSLIVKRSNGYGGYGLLLGLMNYQGLLVNHLIRML